MPPNLVGRAAELDAIGRLLDSLEEGPASLLLEGEPGIGKTTLLLAGVEMAKERGMRVFTCIGSSSQQRLAYATLTDLYREIDVEELADVPVPQREALEAALLRLHPESEIDPLAVATATLAVGEKLATERPLLIAIDDVHWLDTPSARVIEYCAKRTTGPVAVLATARPGTGDGPIAPALTPRDPDRFSYLEVGSLNDAEVAELLRERTPEQTERRLLTRISETSGGNPFYALELSRGLEATDSTAAAVLPLPRSLEEVVTTKI